MLKKLLTITAALLLLTACKTETNPANTIKVGTIAGPETELMEMAKTVAKKDFGLNIQIVEFSDYAIPNTALADGSIDANVFQHQPYLDASIKAHGYHLKTIGKTFVYPMGVYSKRLNDLTQIHDHALVAIPNDPSNEARALLLLEKAGLITLKDKNPLSATPLDISDNPHRIVFREIDAAQLPRVLSDVDFAVINTNFAVPAGLMPKRDAIFKENADSPYANIIVAREGEQERTQLKQLVKALHSIQVLERAKVLFKGQAIPA